MVGTVGTDRRHSCGEHSTASGSRHHQRRAISRHNNKRTASATVRCRSCSTIKGTCWTTAHREKAPPQPADGIPRLPSRTSKLCRCQAATQLADRVSTKGSKQGPRIRPKPVTTDGQAEVLVEAAIQQGNVTLEDVSKVFPFQLDDGQKAAIHEVLEGHSVVASAPTGSGKTAIAEAATVAALARGQRVVYTTPLKALSNQKLYEFRRKFGVLRVGLQTGDASLNAEGDIVIMTTEVMRNIMYRGAHDAQTGRSGSIERLGDVGLLVLDEVHYLGDPSRGSVWEEVIINCPPHIQLLAMSATVGNAEDLGAWIDKVHGSCRTLVSMDRPVPLSWQYCYERGGNTHMRPLLEANGKRINTDLLAGTSDNEWFGENLTVASARKRLSELVELREMLAEHKFEVPAKEDIVQHMHRAGMLPAIWFIFSRAQCDQAARQMQISGVRLTSAAERGAISQEVTLLRREQSEAIREPLVAALLAGVASHHAGCLPGWKSLIERLFQRGLLKLVFATETLAAGINMPARSTILSSVSRRRDAGHSMLTHNELMQMAGRAGRRGFDTQGFCVVVHNFREEPPAAVGLLVQGPEALQSQFESGYGMALNLLFSRSLDQAQDFISRSFSSYLSGEGQARRRAIIEGWEEQAAELLRAADVAQAAAGGAAAAYSRFVSLRATIKERRRAVKGLLSQAVAQRSTQADAALLAASLPCNVGLELDPLVSNDTASSALTAPLPALLLGELQAPEGLTGHQAFVSQHWWLCLAADNRVLRVRSEHVSHVGAAHTEDKDKLISTVAEASMLAPNWRALNGGSFASSGTMKTAPIAARLGALDAATALELETGFTDSIDVLQDEIGSLLKAMAVEKQAAGKQRSSREDLALRARAAKLQKKARNAYKELKGQHAGTWRAFSDVVAVLVVAGALERSTLRPTALGQVARDVQSANQLWMAIVLTHPAIQALTGPQLGGLIGGMVAAESVARPHITAAYAPSEAVLNAVEAMEPARSHLFELQSSGNVMFPLEVDLRLAGVVEAWAAGSSWSQVMADCNLDDGDVARLLSRTVDLLRQASHCSALLPDLRQVARRIAADMSRAPISELVA